MDFDEAKQATEDMFDGQATYGEEDNEDMQQQQLPPDDMQQEEQLQQATPQEQNIDEQQGASEIEEAANIAQVAAQKANEQNQQLQQLLNENAQLKEANSELQETITQQSQQQKQNIIDDAMEMPILDLNRLAFEDEKTVEQMQQEYAQKMQEYVARSVLKDVEPAVQYAKEGMRQKEKTEVLEVLKEVPELNGIDSMIPQLDKIISSNKAFEHMPLDEQYINAYAIAKGINAMNTPAPSDPTADELMKYYESNPEFQQLIEKKRLGDIKSSQQVPPMSASSGAVNAALNIQEKPQTWEDASKRTRDMFRTEQ